MEKYNQWGLKNRMDEQYVNLLAILSANVFNLLIAGIMLSRPTKRKRLEHYLGLVNIALIFPLGFVVAFYIINGIDFWMIALPGLMIIFLFLELLLDYVFKYDFRQTHWLWSYLSLFYAAQWGMIGFGFLVGRVPGFITLLTYFLSLAATAYSYAKVRHGEQN